MPSVARSIIFDMQDAQHTRPPAASRGRAARRALAQPAGEWQVDGAWVEHRTPHVTRRLPVDVVLAALDHCAKAAALGADGAVVLERVRGVRAHHPQHGRWSVELRSTRWEIAWYPRRGSAQRIGLAAAAEQVAARRWRRDAA